MKPFIINPAETKSRFKIGSAAFFEDCPGFVPGDVDEIQFEENPKLFKNFMQLRKKDRTRCFFVWRKMSPDEFIEYALNSPLPMEAGKFLVPEIAEYLGFTIEHLKRLAPVFDKIDERHNYEKIIFESYIQNGAFFLTDEQRDNAFQEYKRTRS